MENFNNSNKDIGEVAKGASVSFLGKIIGRLISFISDVILSRVLGASIFGLFSIGWTIFRILQMVIPLGLPQGLIRYLPKFQKENSKEKITYSIVYAYSISFLSGVIFAIGFYFLSPWISVHIFHKPNLISVFRLFTLVFPFSPILFISTSLFRSKLKMSYSALLEDIGQPLVCLIVLILAMSFSKLSYQWAIASEIVSFVVTAIISFNLMFRFFSPVFTSPYKNDFSLIKTLVTYSIPTSFAGVFSILVFWIDRLFVGIFSSTTDNGIYQVISQLSMVFVILYASFNAILGPTFATLFENKQKERLKSIYQVGTKWNFYFGIIPFIIIILNSSKILNTIFGKEYVFGSVALIVLSLGQLVNCGTGSIGVLLIMTGHQKSWFLMTSIALVINSLLCIVLIPKIGILGAAISTSISVGGMNIFATIFGKLKLDIWPYDKRFIKGLIAGISAISSGVIINLIILPELFSLFLSCSVTMIVFSGMIFIQGLDPEDLEFARKVENRLGIKIGILHI